VAKEVATDSSQSYLNTDCLLSGLIGSLGACFLAGCSGDVGSSSRKGGGAI
jgi:hypothetical protein